MTFVYILLFILFLSILIVVHELGHLTAAKIFNVYCRDFSIGFGPAFLHKKRKGGETYFSLRCIPFGGFVSMYGEGQEGLFEGEENIDVSRRLDKIKKWKQAIIMVAGVTMNAVLALVFFFISEQACVQYAFSINYATYKDDSIVLKAINETEGMDKDKAIYLRGVANKDGNSTSYASLCGPYISYIDEGCEKYIENYDKFLKAENEVIITYKDGTIIDATVCINQSKFTKDNLTYNNMICLFPNYDKQVTKTVKDGEEEITFKYTWRYADISNPIKIDETIMSVKFRIANCEYKITDGLLDAQEATKVSTKNFIELISEPGKMADLGVSMYMLTYWNNYQPLKDRNGVTIDTNAIKKTFVDFGNSSVLIFKGLASLFTPNGWKNVGGIIAIGAATSSTLANYGIGKFLYYWGLISVNLAIVNLFPFPGLDGWQLIVLGVEGITRKKVPMKAKSIMSLIGIGLLFVLMILIIIKDIIALV